MPDGEKEEWYPPELLALLEVHIFCGSRRMPRPDGVRHASSRRTGSPFSARSRRCALPRGPRLRTNTAHRLFTPEKRAKKQMPKVSCERFFFKTSDGSGCTAGRFGFISMSTTSVTLSITRLRSGTYPYVNDIGDFDHCYKCVCVCAQRARSNVVTTCSNSYMFRKQGSAYSVLADSW